MKKSFLIIMMFLSAGAATGQYRKAMFWHHSVGLALWDRSQLSNLLPPTTIPKEIAAYNAKRGLTGNSAVTMTELYFPGPEGVVNDNNWYRWDAVFAGTDSYGQTIDYSTPVLVIKTCYLSLQGMKSIDSIETYKTHIRHIVSVMKNHPNNFFILWTDYPAATDGRSDRAGWSNTFSTWMKQTLAAGNDSFGPFPPNVYVFDIFHKLASPVDGYCDPIYGSFNEGPGGDHPSNAAVALVDSAIVSEMFDAAIAFEQRSAPLVAIQPPSSITTSGVQLNGLVNPNGSTATYHFEYGLTAGYGTATAGQNAGSGTSAVPVNAPVSGLSPGTIYHWRIVAASSGGTAYSADTIVTTASIPVPAPTVLTLGTSNIATTGALISGSVNPNGGSTAYHFEYGTTTGYGAVSSSQNAGSGNAAVGVSVTLSNLTPQTVYHYRLVASNTGGTAYGSDSTFTTTVLPPAATTMSATSITVSGALLNGRINPNGLSTDYHFEYGLSSAYGSSTSPGNVGSGIATVSVNSPLTALTPGTTYHFRLVASNGGGTTYGSDSSFVTATPLPTAVTLAASNITTTGVQLNGSVNPNGFATNYHFEFGTTTSYGNSTMTQSGGSGTAQTDVNAALATLTPGTTYHFRLVATNPGGTAYGSDSTFSTLATPPAVTTLPATAITVTGAQFHGQVNPNGFTTSYHFEYGLTNAYSALTGSQNAGAGTAGVAVSASASGLAPGSLHHYRLVATNIGGTAYGSDTTFTTLIPPPTTVTSPASSVTTTGALLNGSVNPNGFSSSYHFEYGTTTGYGTSTAALDAGSGAASVGVNATLSNLTPGTPYHFRLAATNAGGTTYGNDAVFTTGATPPTATTTAASNVTTVSAQLNGSTNPNGFATSYYFQYGKTLSYGSATSSNNAGSGLTTIAVSAQVSSLAPGTTYHYRLVASNGGGTIYGSDSIFTTLIPPPAVITAAASNITTNGGQLNGSVNPNGFSTSIYFEYGPTASYGTTTSLQGEGSGTGVIAVNAAVSGLTPGARYHYRVVGTSSGGTSYGPDSTFTATSYCAVGIVAFLQGPTAGATMSISPSFRGILAAHFGSATIPSLAVDSINIEVRDSVQAAKSTVRQFAPAWLLADGTILDFYDTTKSFVGYPGVATGNFYVVVRHRNHLAVMSATAIGLNSTVPPAAYDFTSASGQAYGSNSMIVAGTHYALIGGNASNGDQVINALDRVATRNNLGQSDYIPADVNLDGVVNALDRVLARNNLGQSSQVP